MWPAPVQEVDRAGAARRAMWDIGQARRRTLSASSTGPLGCLSAGISSVGRLNRMPRYAFRRPTLYLPRRKSNAGRMECEKCGLELIPLIPAQAGIQVCHLGPRFRGDERTGIDSITSKLALALRAR